MLKYVIKINNRQLIKFGKIIFLKGVDQQLSKNPFDF